MSSRKTRIITAVLVLVGAYALAPFVAGLLKTYDRRGPKLFAKTHHDLLYRLGYYMAGDNRHDGKPRVPYMQERSWFYGVQGVRIPEQQTRENLEVLSPQR